ncbi:hypothetical protein DVH24_012979 [Malus domestica]|uniref:Uncharacterized protein n=1 Tax=Malus domestica TaxID=3750 RepID=A0A498HUP6_MALDO|nr:hypothetical protein DVH24_012979 [Malus domestica]
MEALEVPDTNIVTYYIPRLVTIPIQRRLSSSLRYKAHKRNVIKFGTMIRLLVKRSTTKRCESEAEAVVQEPGTADGNHFRS